MARGEEAAIFDGLKADAEHSMPSIAHVLSGFTDKTASTAEKSLNAHELNESNITGDLNKITDKPPTIAPHASAPAPTGKTTDILNGLTKEDDAAAGFKPKEDPAAGEPKDAEPTPPAGDPAANLPKPKDPTDYNGNPDFRATDADRAAFKANYKGYARDLKFVQDLKAKRPDLQHIPDEDLVAVRGYTGNEFYKPMNAALRNNDAAGLAAYDAHIRVTTSGLNQLPKTPGTFYRGMTIKPGELDGVTSKYEPGQITTEPSFVSTGNAFSGNVHFTAQSVNGRDVSYLSHYPGEAEVLYPPGTQFMVNSKIEPNPGNWEINMDNVG
ncbi:MAG TPA: ADP-ribosyltransferase domain-containing protein [Actinospica sp.]|nr:ADP-ribosyltransferase domain-containing protein [Actinospica sp.]